MIDWRDILLIALATACGVGAASAQTLTGTAGLHSTAGYQTNPYLDPLLAEWDPAAAPAFWAVGPSAGLRWTSPHGTARLSGRLRAYPRQTEGAAVQLAHVAGSGRYRVSGGWSAALQAGARRYRLAARRDAWWVLPSVRWRPTRRLALDGYAGLTGHRSGTGTAVTGQTSTLAMVAGTLWLTGRLCSRVRLYRSGSQTTAATTTYSGTGASGALTFWPAADWALTAEMTGDQIRYESAAAGVSARTNQLWRAGLKAEWTVRRGVQVFAQVRGMRADLGSSVTWDGRMGAGVRLQVSRTLVRSDASRPRRGLWTMTERGAQIRIRYDGAGQPYVTGDFNDWATPGIPLQPAGDGVYRATVPCPPGRYEYNIRIVDGGQERWMELPDEARTVRDGFGGENGVVIVK